MQHATQAALLCASEHWCAFCFHANSLSSFIFLTSSSYASDELGLLQILLKCTDTHARAGTHTHTHNTPYTTPLQRNKTKTLRSYKCKPVILLVSAPWLTNGTTDRIFPLHFNLEYIPCSFYLLASIFCCCELLCATQFISIMETVAERVALWVSNDLQLHWCQYLRGKKEGGGLLRIKGLDLKRTSVSLQMHFLKMLRWILPAVTERQFPGPGLYVCVCVRKRGDGKSGISWSPSLWDINEKIINFPFFCSLIFNPNLDLRLINIKAAFIIFLSAQRMYWLHEKRK